MKLSYLRYIFLTMILCLCAACNENPPGPGIESNPGILITDEFGNISSGDSSDWCFKDTSAGRSRFLPAYPNSSNGLVNIRFFIPIDDTVSVFTTRGNDTTYLINNELRQAGTYELQFNGFNFLGFYQRFYFKSSTLFVSENCNNFGDVKFENSN